MEEVLQRLLEAEVLTEESKTELKKAFDEAVNEAVEAAKEETAADVRAELTEQWVKDKDELIEAIDSKVTEFLQNEIDELREDIDRFRDLEAEFAEKLVEAKAAMSDELQGDIVELVEKISTFLEIRLADEMDELREDLDEVRKNDFGRKIYESFAEEFVSNYADEESAEASLRETETRLADVEEALAESEAKRAEMEREIKLETVLSPLAGQQRDVMAAILANVETNKLDEGYATFISRVLRETEEDSEKEGKVLAEGESEEEKDDDKAEDKKSKKKDSDKECDDEDEKVDEGVVVTGDSEEMINENADPELAARLAHIQKLAGIK